MQSRRASLCAVYICGTLVALSYVDVAYTMEGLQTCDNELEHVSSPHTWQSTLTDGDGNATEGARRTNWFDERRQQLQTERLRRIEWDRKRHVELAEEMYKRDKFLAYTLLNDFREHRHRDGWTAYEEAQSAAEGPPVKPNSPPPALRALPPPPSSPEPSSPMEQADRQSTTSSTQYVDMAFAVVDPQYSAVQQTNTALGYDTPRPIADSKCHLCDVTCADGRQLRRHLRSKHPEECDDLFHCSKCKLNFVRRDSALNHYRRFHSRINRTRPKLMRQ